MTEQDKNTETLLAEIEVAFKGLPQTVETLRSCTLSVLKAFVGVHEIGKTNTGHWVDIFFRSIGMRSGLHWCVAVIQYAYKYAAGCLGLPDPLSFNTAGTLALAKWAREKGYAVWTFAEVKAGDLIVWQNGEGSPEGHVAAVTSIEYKAASGVYIVTTIEGNTSQGLKNEKDYRDGGTVAPKEYAYSDENINPDKQSSKRFIRTIISFDKIAAEVVK